jgi:hypothetical protein
VTDTERSAPSASRGTPIRRVILEVLGIIALVLAIVIMLWLIAFGVRLETAIGRIGNAFNGAAASTTAPSVEPGPTSGPCIGYGCSPEQDAQINGQEAQAGVHEVGESVPFQTAGADGTVTVTSAKRVSSQLLADVTIKVADGRLPLPPASFAVQDKQGRTYSPAVSASKPFTPDPVSSGESASGQLAFDVPPGPAILSFGGAEGVSPLAVFQL